MNLKHFSGWLILFVLINCSTSWSSTVNSILKPNQLQFGKTPDPDFIDTVASGAQMAMDECRKVFKWDRWNCPQSSFSRQTKQIPTKEKAYTEAIVAAGVVFAITRNCSKGELKGCGCDLSLSGPNMSVAKLLALKETNKNIPIPDWTWGGCSDDPRFGEKIVLKALRSPGKGSDVQALVTRHNNKIGREIIREMLVKKCRCHGVSGSCSLQTCWKQMVPFSRIAQELRARYQRAKKVSYDDIISGNSGRSRKILPEGSQKNLVYLEDSPDFCVVNLQMGIQGTRGRICSKSKLENVEVAERRSCRKLCRSCGYKVKKLKKTVSYRCNCKFMWCCEVKCETCVENVEEFFCE